MVICIYFCIKNGNSDSTCPSGNWTRQLAITLPNVPSATHDTPHELLYLWLHYDAHAFPTKLLQNLVRNSISAVQTELQVMHHTSGVHRSRCTWRVASSGSRSKRAIGFFFFAAASSSLPLRVFCMIMYENLEPFCPCQRLVVTSRGRFTTGERCTK